MKKNNSSVNLQFPHLEQEVYCCTFYRSLLYFIRSVGTHARAHCEFIYVQPACRRKSGISLFQLNIIQLLIVNADKSVYGTVQG